MLEHRMFLTSIGSLKLIRYLGIKTECNSPLVSRTSDVKLL